MKLKDRTAVVTGGNQGLGRSIVSAFLREGASVIYCGRDKKTLADSLKEFKSLCGMKQTVYSFQVDLASERQILSFWKKIKGVFGTPDILVNNAGILGPKGYLEQTPWFDWVKAINVNLLAVARMCQECLPAMKKRRYGKIINLSGGGATQPFPRLTSYAASKAAVVRFTESLAEEVKTFGINVNAVAPGALKTRLLQEMINAGPQKVGKKFYNSARKIFGKGGANPERAADLCVFLASEESTSITGKLISAVWDDWESLAKYKSELRQSDIFTLRRITPKERGKNWGFRK